MKTKHALLLMILLTVSSVSLLAQTITSDKEDYSPGEVAIITGTGWTSDQFVDVHFEEDPVIEHHHGYHDIAVDEDGNFTIYYDILDRHLGVKFTVTAVGQQSGLSAFTIFYDGNISINGNANGATVNCPGAPVTLTAGAFNCKDAVGDCFSWYRDNGDGLAGAGDAFLGSTTSGTFNTTAPAAGTYKYYVVGYQNGTASASELDLLTVSNTPLTTAISLTGNNTTLDICSGTSTNIQFSNGPSNGIVTYNINGGSDQTVNLNAGGNASFSSGALTSQTTYNLVSVSAGGCSNSVSGSVVVNINTAPVLTVPADISVNNDPELCSASVSFLASVTGTPTPSIVYSIAGSPVTSPYVFPVGTTTVTVTATNTCGTDIETFNVTVVDNIDPTITAPAGFTITADAGEDFATGVDLGTPATADNCAVATVTNDAVDPLPVGTHLITWTVTDVNGNSATAEQVVIVEPSIIYITVTADAVSKTYGDADPELTYQITSGALGGSDVFTGSLTRVAGEDAGEYDILLGSLAAGPQYNYEITFVGAKLTITQRSASVTPDAASKIYGDADPAFTGTLTGFLVADGVTAVYNRTVGETVLGSPYTISAVLSPAEVLSNYDITYNTAEFTIDAKAASVTPDAASKTYGDADPAFTGTLTGFLVADGVTAVYNRTAGETVLGSPYTISAVLSPAEVLSNYDITYNTAEFTIDAKAASVTPDAASKTYGDADPAFTGTLTGFLMADGVTAVYSRTAGETVLGSPYTISAVLSPAGVLSNYDITYNTAEFTIDAKAASVTPDAASKTYGDADPAFTGTLTGFLVADGVTAVYSRTAGETVAGSPYTISAVLSPAGVLSNYSITYNTAIFTINQRPITIAAVDASKFCGQTDPTLTYSIAAGSVAAGETLTVVLTRETGESAGTYAINGTVNIADGAAVNVNSNYDITYTPGVFTINGISVTVADANTVPVAVGNPVTLTASVSSAIPGSLAGIPVVFVLDDGNAATAEISITGTTDASGFVSVSLTGLATEVYKITVTAGSACASTIVYKPIYDPSGGFVTGGGWIMSLPGSYPADAAATGKAHFGFVSKYKKGSNVPEGNTEFQFHAGNLNFASSSYNSGSLVVAGSQAIYKGVGTINGSGSYQFMVSVVDGSPDKFRMKITNGSTVVYDNNMGADENANAATALGGGSIVIHAVKGKATEAAIVVNEIVIEHLNVYPNPVDETINVSFASPSKAAVNFNLVDMNGRSLVAQTDNVNLEGKYSIPVGNLGLRAGLYVLRVSQESTSKIIKVIKK